MDLQKLFEQEEQPVISKPYRIIVTSDWHCGATTGLTRMDRDYGYSELVEYQDRREELWNLFTAEMQKIEWFNELWIVGDAVNGPARGETRRDNLNNVLDQQVWMAKDILDWVKERFPFPWSVLVVEGTEWHVGDGGAEHDIALHFGTRATKGKMIERCNRVFDVKHATGGSNRHHLVGNALTQEYTAAVNNHAQHGTPIPDVIVRAHRHVHTIKTGVRFKDGKKVPWIAVILPALQTWGSDYAKRMMASAYPDIGFCHIDISPGRIHIEPHIFHLKTQVPL